ncbi:hypothetical protein O3P69_001648 [Scylla paramamosain]|uniref:Uncharacterized protein n=1 Tax=Scylla paramamosain TaxID=85552 RepID=A0AAW0V2W1_SCYPA
MEIPIGLDNAGKTTLVKRFCDKDISTISSAYSSNIKTVEHVIDKYEYKLNIWDIVGMSSFQSYWWNYFECTDILIWVVDSADGNHMRDCQGKLKKLAASASRSSACVTASMAAVVERMNWCSCVALMSALRRMTLMSVWCLGSCSQ